MMHSLLFIHLFTQYLFIHLFIYVAFIYLFHFLSVPLMILLFLFPLNSLFLVLFFPFCSFIDSFPLFLYSLVFLHLNSLLFPFINSFIPFK
jgi:hypothetical protein